MSSEYHPAENASPYLYPVSMILSQKSYSSGIFLRNIWCDVYLVTLGCVLDLGSLRVEAERHGEDGKPSLCSEY